MSMEEVDFGMSRELRWRRFRRRLAAVALAVGVVQFVGAPAVRISAATGRGEASYVSFEGAVSLPNAEAEPLIVMVPLKRSVIDRAGDVLEALRQEWFSGS